MNDSTNSQQTIKCPSENKYSFFLLSERRKTQWDSINYRRKRNTLNFTQINYNNFAGRKIL